MSEEKKMDKKETIKNVLSAISGAGVWQICQNIVTHTAPSTAGFLAKALVLVGSTVLTGMLKDKATEYVGEKTDMVFESIEKWQSESSTDEELEEDE